MPNHTTSIIRAPAEVITSFIHRFGPASLDSIVPFQGSVKLSPAGKELLSIYRYYVTFTNQDINTQTFYDKKEAAFYKKLLKKVSIEEQQLIQQICSKNYGFEKLAKFIEENPNKGYKEPALGHWYTWNVRNFGCKWDLYDVYVDYDQIGFAELSFNTAWSAPFQVFEALSKMFPSTLINVASADEGSETSVCLLSFLDGVIVSNQSPYNYKVNGEYYEAHTDKWINLWRNIKMKRCVSFENPDAVEFPPPQLEGYFAI